MLLQDNCKSFTPQELYGCSIKGTCLRNCPRPHYIQPPVSYIGHHLPPPPKSDMKEITDVQNKLKVENVTNDNSSRNNLTSGENGKKNPNERCKKKETRRKPEESASCPKRRRKQKAFILTTGEDLISDISLCVYM